MNRGFVPIVGAIIGTEDDQASVHDCTSSSPGINPADSVYTTTENVYVLLVIKADGTIIAMTNPAFCQRLLW